MSKFKWGYFATILGKIGTGNNGTSIKGTYGKFGKNGTLMLNFPRLQNSNPQPVIQCITLYNSIFQYITMHYSI